MSLLSKACQTYRSLEMRIELLDNMHPKGAAPFHAALLEEEDQPATSRHESQHRHISVTCKTATLDLDSHMPVGRSSLSFDHLQDVIGCAVSLSLSCLFSQPHHNPHCQ